MTKMHGVNNVKFTHSVLYRAKLAVCYEIYTKRINSLCRINLKFLNVKLLVQTVIAGL
jgi:hypothetical protein